MNYLRVAAMVAQQGIAAGHGGPFGAVIVKNGKIVAQAHNTVLKRNDPTCHAEINTIRRAARKLNSIFLKGCTLYSTTEPCPMCFSAIHWAKIPKIIYSTTIHDVQQLGFNELSLSNSFLIKMGKSPVKSQRRYSRECEQLLKDWLLLPNKKTY